MKTLILALLMAFTLQAQTIFDIGTGILVSDTLKQSSTASTVDTIDYIPLNYEYDWLNITVIDTGATYTDSLVAEYPTHSYTLKSGTTRRWEISDTTWADVQFMKDSTWGDVDVMANSDAISGYRIFVGDYLEVRIRMTNVEVIDSIAVADRSVWYKAQAVRKK